MEAATSELLGAEFHADPAPLLHRMRRERPVAWDPVLGAWVLTRYRDVSQVVRDPDFSVDRGGSISQCDDDSVRDQLAWCSRFVLGWMVFADPPRHTRLRAAVHRAFTGQAMERLRPVIVAATAAAMAQVAPSGRIEVLADLAVPVPAEVTAALLGLPADDAALLKAWTADMFALFGAGVASAAQVRPAYASMRACRDYFAEVIDERRHRGRGDLLSELACADLDDDEIIGLCATLVAGAYETTTHVVGNGLWQLLRHPGELARLRAEPARIDNAVEELFRYDGPALSVVRRARTETRIGDVTIAAGDRLYCMLYAANRDPERFVDPDRLDLARRDVHHLGLGHGIHFCLGAALSRLEAAIMLGAVIQLDELRLDRDALAGSEPRYLPNLAIRGLDRLPLCFRPRHGPLDGARLAST